MEMLIDFPGGARVDAHFNGLTVRTDQPPAGGGTGSAPTPFAHFLASIGTCAGIYVLGFCRQRGLPTDGITIKQTVTAGSKPGMIDHIDLEIRLPADFPDQYKDSVVRTAELCAVKQHLETPPSFSIRAATFEPA